VAELAVPAPKGDADLDARSATVATDDLVEIVTPGIQIDPSQVLAAEQVSFDASSEHSPLALASLVRKAGRSNADDWEASAGSDQAAAARPPFALSGEAGSPELADATGAGGEDDHHGMLQRLRSAGARTGDIQVSLVWNNLNDIDLWIERQLGRQEQESVGWSRRMCKSGGWLDIDANCREVMQVTNPVENIFWPYKQGRSGKYTVYIHFFRQWDRQNVTPVQVRIKVGDKVMHKTAVLRQQGEFRRVHEFTVTLADEQNWKEQIEETSPSEFRPPNELNPFLLQTLP
jgi:hypothetical protein